MMIDMRYYYSKLQSLKKMAKAKMIWVVDVLSESQVNCLVISSFRPNGWGGVKEDNLLASFSEKTGAWTEFSLSADLGTQHCQRGPPLQTSLVTPPARVQAKLRPQLYLTPLYSQLGCITKFGSHTDANISQALTKKTENKKKQNHNKHRLCVVNDIVESEGNHRYAKP